MPIVSVNQHDMYYEIHGPDDSAAPTVLCTTGWGTFCHGDAHHLPRGLTDRFRVIIYDHRGIARSGDNPDQRATMRLRADDVCALLDHLETGPVHLVGIAGMGACICQETAINRPDLCRSLVNSGAWAQPDKHFDDTLDYWLDVHRTMGFAAFQKLVTLLAFDPEFYNANSERLLGPDGGWRELNGRIDAHARITDSCKSHDSLARLHLVKAPTFVIHMGRDQITPPRLTLPIEQNIQNASSITMPDATHVPTGRVLKKQFDDALLTFLDKVDAISV